MSKSRFNTRGDGTVRVIHLRTGRPTKGGRALTGMEVARLRTLLTARLHTINDHKGTDACVGVALSGSAWITLMSGSLPSRTCMDMSAYAAGALAVMLSKKEE